MASHRINRLELEVTVEGVEQGQALIDRLSLLHERRIAPLIDRVCSEVSGPERLDRIDELELELGTIALERFDEEFLRALEAALRAALTRWIAESPDPAGQRPESAAFELLESFARTGNLPWSAERGQADLIASTIDLLLRRAPERWIDLLHALHDDRVGLARLAQHCDDARIEAIAEQTGLGHAGWIAELGELERWILAPLARGSSRVAREQVRVAWLAGLAHAGPRPTSAVVLRSTIGQLFALAPVLLLDVARRAPAFESARLHEALAGVRTHVARAPRERAEDEPDESSESSEDIERSDTLADGEPADEPRVPPRTRVDRSVESSESDGSEIETSESDASEIETSESDASEIDAPEIGASEAHESTHALDSSSSTNASEPEPVERPRAARPDGTEPPSLARVRRRALERLEQLEVADAGLVILWPFLERFFLRVGLLNLDRRFVDDQAAQQAIALLSQLAIEDPEPPEYLLALAKLLCGRAPETEFRLLAPLEPEAIAECDHLLRAVITNAPILRDMSIAGFRASFLRRPALLCVRDGTWLLQVERQPHDLVLERFPWSWSWVKLPWMIDPLRVEW